MHAPLSHPAFASVLTAFFCASCADRPAIAKDPAPSAEEHAHQGTAVETAPVETKVETPSPVVSEAPKRLTSAPAPNAGAWAEAATVDSRNKGCEVRRIDSFVRVRCVDGNRVEQLVGDAKSVKFGCFSNGDPKCAVFRLEPGERRILQFSSATFAGNGEWEGGGFVVNKVAVVSAWWPRNATEPRIAVD